MRVFWIAALILSLLGCGSSNDVTVSAPPRAAEPIAVQAERIEIEVKSRSFAAGAPGETEFLVSPEQVARNWPDQRLRVGKGTNSLRYVVDNVGVTSERSSTGETVIASIDARLILRGAGGQQINEAVAQARAQTRFTRGATTAERWQALQLLSDDLAKQLDMQLTASVQRQFAGYIVPSVSAQVERVPGATPQHNAPMPVPVAPVEATSGGAYADDVASPPAEIVVDLSDGPAFVPAVPVAAPVASGPVVFIDPPPQPTEAVYIGNGLEIPDPPVVTYEQVALPSPQPPATVAVLPSIPEPAPQLPAEQASVAQVPPLETAPAQIPKAKPRVVRTAPPAALSGPSTDLTKGVFLPGSSAFPALPR